MNHKTYLGDSVYADWDGYQLVLTTEQGDGVASNIIYLEDQVIGALFEYLKLLQQRLSSPVVEEGHAKD